MEIILAFALGSIQANLSQYGIPFWIDMSQDNDERQIDFKINHAAIQLKFGYSDEDIVVFYAGPSSKFIGTKYLEEDRGDNILLNILLSMDVYDFDEACDIIDDHRGLKRACIEAWEIIRN